MSDEPSWFDRDVLEQSEIWLHKTVATMPRFLDQYTLHDSFFRQLRIRPNFEVVLIIDFDLVWNRSIPPDFETLIIAFPKAYRVTYANGSPYGATIASATAQQFTLSEREILFERAAPGAAPGQPDETTSYVFDEHLTRTTIVDIFWGTTEILHGAEVYFLVLDNAGKAYTSLLLPAAGV